MLLKRKKYKKEECFVMYADELLKVLIPHLNDYYSRVLRMWIKTRKTHGMFKRKTTFDVKPTPFLKGYYVQDMHRLDIIIVYDKTSEVHQAQ